jgi:hypothetical protein
MTNQAATAYQAAVWNAVQSPDAWDVGGASFGGSEQIFKEFGRLVGKLRLGTLAVGDVELAGRVQTPWPAAWALSRSEWLR